MNTQKFTVMAASGLNVRSEPRIGNNNQVGSLLDGEVINVVADEKEISPDGWVWRRIALPASGKYWAAEVNQNTGNRLLQPTISETVQVITSILNVRREPDLNAELVDRLAQGNKIEVSTTHQVHGSFGWVWRQIVPSGHWIASWNEQSGQQLVRPFPTKPVVLGRVKTVGTSFVLDTQSFRFIGANMREFPFYPHSVMPHATAAHQDKQLRAIRDELGMRVVRMHAAHNQIPDTTALVEKALDKIHAAGLLAIAVLNDSLGDREYYVPGEKQFHTEPLGHLHKRYYHDQHYENTYIPFVQNLVTALKDHPGIFCWELGNEFAIHPQPATATDADAFLAFVQRSAGLIRSIDPNHLISIGLLNTGQIVPDNHDQFQFALQLYSETNVDFGTVHFYQGQSLEEDRAFIDLAALQQLDKPLIVEEFGSTVGHQNRVDFTRKRLNTWFNQGAVGFMQWGVSLTGSDIDAGDLKHGLDDFSSQNAPFFPALKDLYRQWARQVQ